VACVGPQRHREGGGEYATFIVRFYFLQNLNKFVQFTRCFSSIIFSSLVSVPLCDYFSVSTKRAAFSLCLL